MRHQRAGRKLGRTTSHRWAMFRNMLTSFFEWGKIETTTPKAKELRPLAEKIISLGRRGDLAARRQVLELIPNKKVVRKIFNEISPKFKDRPGGYTRIIHTGFRAGDNAPLSVIEIISEAGVKEKKRETKKKKIEPKVLTKAKKEQEEKTISDSTESTEKEAKTAE